jgi:hypothetical protein
MTVSTKYPNEVISDVAYQAIDIDMAKRKGWFIDKLVTDTALGKDEILA